MRELKRKKNRTQILNTKRDKHSMRTTVPHTSCTSNKISNTNSIHAEI